MRVNTHMHGLALLRYATIHVVYEEDPGKRGNPSLGAITPVPSTPSSSSSESVGPIPYERSPFGRGSTMMPASCLLVHQSLLSPIIEQSTHSLMRSSAAQVESDVSFPTFNALANNSALGSGAFITNTCTKSAGFSEPRENRPSR